MQGLLVSDEGIVYEHEHGPRGGDELNIIEPGKNYGWPAITYGIDYSGARISPFTEMDGMEQPLKYWSPSIAPSGMAFYQGAMFPQFDGHLLVGSLKFERLYLVRVANDLPQEEFIILENTIGRVRDVAVAPDGAILLLSDESDGGLYRLSEAGQ